MPVVSDQLLPPSSSDHVVVYPFRVATSQGGLKSVLLREAALHEGGIDCISADTEGLVIDRLTVRPTDPFPADGKDYETELDKRQVGVGHWEILYAAAFTAPTVDREVLKEMYAAHESTHEFGSLAFLNEYILRHCPPPEVEAAFAERYRSQLLAVRPGSIVNWQDFFVSMMVDQHAERLRAQGCFQTMHHHECVDPNLAQSDWGRWYLRAISKVDQVFVHTDQDVATLRAQMEGLRLRIPEIRRFDLGIDEAWVRAGAARLPALRAGVHHEGFDADQHELIAEVVRSFDKVPHRFICLDRLDPTKGVDVVLRAVDAFLAERQAAGEDIASKYRFFFLHELYDQRTFDRVNLLDQYARYTQELHRGLQERYPGVVYAARSLKGPNRAIIPALVQDCHALCGAVADGKNLAVQEIMSANRSRDTTAIVGSGAGFAVEVQRLGFGSEAYFPRAGSVSAMLQALHSVVTTKSTSPGLLGTRKLNVVSGYIDTCKDSVVVGRPQ